MDKFDTIMELDLLSTDVGMIKMLLCAFFEDYCADTDAETLIYDAKKRPEMISAKLCGVLALIDNLESHMRSIVEQSYNHARDKGGEGND